MRWVILFTTKRELDSNKSGAAAGEFLLLRPCGAAKSLCLNQVLALTELIAIASRIAYWLEFSSARNTRKFHCR